MLVWRIGPLILHKTTVTQIHSLPLSKAHTLHHHWYQKRKKKRTLLLFRLALQKGMRVQKTQLQHKETKLSFARSSRHSIPRRLAHQKSRFMDNEKRNSPSFSSISNTSYVNPFDGNRRSSRFLVDYSVDDSEDYMHRISSVASSSLSSSGGLLMHSRSERLSSGNLDEYVNPFG